MDFLLDPNIAYLILLAGVILSFLAIATPGTGLLEISSVFCYLLAGYAAYNIGIRWWALGILVVSLVPFLYALRDPKRTVYLGGSILLLVIGSVFLFSSEEGLISVNPIVALVASVISGGSMWLLLRKSIEAISRKPTHDLDALVGQMGEARTTVHDDGSVFVAGEMWSAKSAARIAAGSHIKVVKREGFVLVVEKVQPNS
jgi:membrane-bound serine protease (ClpP class)